MEPRSLCLILMLSLWCAPSSVPAAASVPPDPGASVTDGDTGAVFPSTVSFVHDGRSHELTITGLAVRTRLFFNVYCLAHYMEEAPREAGEALFRAIMSDGQAKQITMQFVRDVSAQRIQDALREGLERNATPEELAAIRPQIDEFARAIHRDVRERDVFTIRWVPGGTTVSVFEGRTVTRITNATFARVLWSIWFGNRSVVDRDRLVHLIMAGS